MMLFIASFAIILTNHLVFRSKTNYILSSNIFSITISVLIISLIYSKAVSNQGILFYSIYPILALILLGKKRGNFISVIFFVFTLMSKTYKQKSNCCQVHVTTIKFLFVGFKRNLYSFCF